jgi:DNA-binding transcriptional MocR family regulator
MGTLDPLYKHVKQQIIASPSEGEWKPGELMPSEPILAARYQVGISTIPRRAPRVGRRRPGGAPSGQGHLSQVDTRHHHYHYRIDKGEEI